MDTVLPVNSKETISASTIGRSVVIDSAVDWKQITLEMGRGNSNALSSFYEFTFETMLAEILRVSGRDEQTCLDIVHEAMLKAIRCIKPLPTSQAVAAWSRTVAKTAAYDWLRREARTSHWVAESSTSVPGYNEAVRDYEMDAARLVWLEEQLAELPHDLQKLISLRYRLGWSLKRIGQLAGMKTGAVDGRIRRALEQLKRKAAKEFQDEG